ncbi:MAG: DUF177 domain-containing protein [Myxococcota bacterium]
MKIAIESLPVAGREIRFGRADGWAAEAAAQALDRPAERLEGRIDLKRASQSGVVVVDVSVTAAAPTTCDRCGEPCELAVSVDTRLLFAPGTPEAGPESEAFDGISLGTDSQESSAELELRSDDLDLGWYKDGELVLGDVLSEALALAVPPKVVCADSAECDRRTDALLATAKVADGPFAVLGALKRRPDTES